MQGFAAGERQGLLIEQEIAATRSIRRERRLKVFKSTIRPKGADRESFHLMGERE